MNGEWEFIGLGGGQHLGREIGVCKRPVSEKSILWGSRSLLNQRCDKTLCFPQSWNSRAASGAHTQLFPSTHICHICPITCFGFMPDSGHPYHHCHETSLIHSLLAESLLFQSGLPVSEFSIPIHPFPMTLHFLRHFQKIFLNSL